MLVSDIDDVNVNNAINNVKLNCFEDRIQGKIFILCVFIAKHVNIIKKYSFQLRK